MTGRAMCGNLRTAWSGPAPLPPAGDPGGDLPSAIHGVPDPTPSTGGNGKTQIMPMAELEKQTILSTIAQLNGDKLLAARMLGIGKTTLYRKLKEYVAQD